MAALCNATNVPFVGGSAADELRFERTTIFENFRPRVGCSVLALLTPRRSYSILKTQSFSVLEGQIEITKTANNERVIHSLNGRPAASEYAACLGLPLAGISEHFHAHPFGVIMDNGKPFVRGLQRAEGEAIHTYCAIREKTLVSLLAARDIVEQTRTDLSSTLSRLGRAECLISFDCVERMQELRDRGQIDSYASLFEDLPSIGVATYGESYIGHLNQTSTLLILG